MSDLSAPRPALVLATWVVLGLALGIGFGLAAGDGMIEEIALGVVGALIGGTLHTLIGGRRRGLKFLLLGALIGAMVLILMHDLMEAL